MVEGVDVKLLVVQKGHREALCSAKHMVGENAVQHQGAPKVLRGPHHFAKAMVEENAVQTTVVEFVLKVCMEVPTSVWHMGVE